MSSNEDTVPQSSLQFTVNLVDDNSHKIINVLSCLGSFEEEALQAHNEYRKIHDAPPMTLDSSMSQDAAAYAQRLANMNTLQHSSSNDGENLAMACGSQGLSAQRAVDMW